MDKYENQISFSHGEDSIALRGFLVTVEIPFKHEACFHIQLFVWKSIDGLTVSSNRVRVAAAKIPVSISILHESAAVAKFAYKILYRCGELSVVKLLERVRNGA